MLAYKHRGDPITPADMQAVFTGFENKLINLLNSKSFIVAFRDGACPAALLGKPIFFNDGKPTAWSHNVPGAVTFNANTIDPVTAAPVVGTGVRSYDHSYFATAAAAATVSTDAANGIRYIADVPQAAYPPGLQKLNAISLFEHSLDTHENAQGYFLGELQQANGNGGGYFPTKRYEHACVDLIIENLNALAIPAAHDRKYACVRAHNLSLVPCTLTLSGYVVVIPPLGCVTVRRTWNASTKAWQGHRLGTYFFPIDSTDTCFFWHWPTLPSFVNPAQRTDTPVTAASGAQGNNVSNPAVLCDFVSALRWSPITTNHAWLNLDVHELCDMGADFADYFPALKNTPDFPAAEKGQLRQDAKLFDLLAHSGRIELKKVRAVAQAAGNLITSSVFQYRGLKTLMADFAAAGITVGLSADGNYQFSKTEAGYFWDLLPIGTNLLRWGTVLENQWDSHWQKLPVALNLATAKKIDPRILENGGLTNPFGTTAFTLRTQSDYRIAQRSLAAIARARQYTNAAGQLTTVNGAPDNQIALALGVPSVVGGVHLIGAAEYRDTLRFHGDGGRADQSDAHVTYTGQRLTMTPNGLVLTFTERVRGDVPSYNQSPAYSYAPIAGMETSHVRYTFNAALSVWEAKHCVRFRKHGFPIAEFGKQFAHAYSVAKGRCTGPDYQYVRKGPAGADVRLAQSETVTAVKQMRSVLITELTANDARFWQPYAVDGWVAYDASLRDRYAEVGNNGAGYFYKFRSSFLSGTAPGGVSDFGRCPMTTEGINSLIQLVNQCTTGKPLAQDCLIIMAGNKRMRFSDLHWSAFPGPAPKSAYARIDHLSDRLYWKQWLAARGVPVLTLADLPASFHTHRNTSSEYRTVTQQATATISNATYAGYRLIYEIQPGGGLYYWAIFNGTVTMQINDPQFSGPAAFNAGVAAIGDPRFGGNVALNTDYNAVEWIDQGSVRAWVESVGLSYWRVEPIVPLKLGVWTLPAEFEPSPEIASVKTFTYQGEIASETTDYHVSVGPPPGPPANAISQLNGVTDTRTYFWNWNNNTLTSLTTKQLAFRLADTAEECDWKLLLPSNRPPLSFYVDRGRYDFRVYQQVGFRVNKIAKTRAGVTVRTFPLTNAAPWLPTFYDMSPNPAQNEGTDADHQWVRISTVDACNPAGARLYAQLKQTDLGDEYFAFQNGDRQWHAMDVQTSDGVSLPVTLVPVPAWGVVKDWWKESQDVFLSSLASVATAKPEDMPAGAPNPVNCPEGITVLKPGPKSANLAFFDPTLLGVEL